MICGARNLRESFNHRSNWIESWNCHSNTLTSCAAITNKFNSAAGIYKRQTKLKVAFNMVQLSVLFPLLLEVSPIHESNAQSALKTRKMFHMYNGICNQSLLALLLPSFCPELPLSTWPFHMTLPQMTPWPFHMTLPQMTPWPFHKCKFRKAQLFLRPCCRQNALLAMCLLIHTYHANLQRNDALKERLRVSTSALPQAILRCLCSAY